MVGAMKQSAHWGITEPREGRSHFLVDLTCPPRSDLSPKIYSSQKESPPKLKRC